MQGDKIQYWIDKLGLDQEVITEDRFTPPYYTYITGRRKKFRSKRAKNRAIGTSKPYYTSKRK